MIKLFFINLLTIIMMFSIASTASLPIIAFCLLTDAGYVSPLTGVLLSFGYIILLLTSIFTYVEGNNV